MEKSTKKPLIGIQGSVLGWDDPWHYGMCSRLMRTGERQPFPSQDPKPEIKEFVSFIKEMGVDFYLHHVMPNEKDIDSFIDSISHFDLPFFLGNEYGNINKVNDGISNRYDIPDSCVKKAKLTDKLLGLIYDETEHLQLHPDIYSCNQQEEYRNLPPVHQWASTAGKTLVEIENDVVNSVKIRVGAYGGDISLYSEQVFPVMFHTLARGGMNPCPKVMKEEFQSIQLSTALGAAKQYKRGMGICVDLWGPDIGEWFTRLWGFPGHSPAEFKSALEMAYLMGPDFLYVENIDPLAQHSEHGFFKTEYGVIFEEFIKKYVPENPRYYNHSMLDPDIVIVRSDDADISRSGGFNGRGLYGSNTLKSNFMTQSAFDVFHLLSHKTTPLNGVTYWLPQFHFPITDIPRTEEALKNLPLSKGMPGKCEKSIHHLFYPMNNVAVFDERVDDASIGNPGLIFLAGSRLTDSCLKAISKKVRNGATCVAAKWLMPQQLNTSRNDGYGKWFITDNFLDPDLLDVIEPFLGARDCWTQRFGEYEVRFYDLNGDGLTLVHDIYHK